MSIITLQKRSLVYLVPERRYFLLDQPPSLLRIPDLHVNEKPGASARVTSDCHVIDYS
jgi:hypothetical protein